MESERVNVTLAWERAEANSREEACLRVAKEALWLLSHPAWDRGAIDIAKGEMARAMERI